MRGMVKLKLGRLLALDCVTLFLCSVVVMQPGVALANSAYQDAVSDLARASYDHLKVTYKCRSVLGASVTREARTFIENALRATGVPTDVAFQSAGRMARVAAAEADSEPDMAVNECLWRILVTKNGVARTRARVNAEAAS